MQHMASVLERSRASHEILVQMLYTARLLAWGEADEAAHLALPSGELPGLRDGDGRGVAQREALHHGLPARPQRLLPGAGGDRLPLGALAGWPAPPPGLPAALQTPLQDAPPDGLYLHKEPAKALQCLRLPGGSASVTTRPAVLLTPLCKVCLQHVVLNLTVGN